MRAATLVTLSLPLALSLALACGASEDSLATQPGGAAGAGGDAAGSAGSGGTGVGGAAGAAGVAGGAGAGGAATVTTLAEVQAALFTPSCATSLCHSAKQKAGGLSLASEADSCAALVGVPATESGPTSPSSCSRGGASALGLLRVKPGSLTESFTYLKVSSPDKCVTIEGVEAGERMPKGKPAASQAAVDSLARWIEAGAACE